MAFSNGLYFLSLVFNSYYSKDAPASEVLEEITVFMFIIGYTEQRRIQNCAKVFYENC